MGDTAYDGNWYSRNRNYQKILALVIRQCQSQRFLTNTTAISNKSFAGVSERQNIMNFLCLKAILSGRRNQLEIHETFKVNLSNLSKQHYTSC